MTLDVPGWTDILHLLKVSPDYVDDIARLLADDEFDHAMLLTPGRDRPRVLRLLWETTEAITVDQLRDMIPDAWVGADRPVQGIGQRSWVRMFNAAGYIFRSYSDAAFDCGFDLANGPMSHLTVYRGATSDSRGRGMSWTLDLERARWFANRCTLMTGEHAGVFSALLPPGAVLAVFNDRAEQEIVVNPHMLRDRVTLVESAK